MTAIILERDEHSRAVMAKLLLQLGFSHILAAPNLHRCQYFLARYGSKVSLIVASEMAPGQVFAEFGDLLAHNVNTGFVPLLQVQDNWLSKIRQAMASSRIDGQIARPFGLKKLQIAVERAHVNRGRHRDLILLVDENSPQLADLETSVFHWREMRVQTPEQLREHLENPSSRLGAILIHPKIGASSQIANALEKFKRTHAGRLTPAAVLSRNPVAIREFRLVADLFFEHPESNAKKWSEVLSQLSRRTIYGYGMRNLIISGRRAMKEQNTRHCLQLAKIGLNLDPTRREMHELAGAALELQGRHTRAADHFKRALNENPCSPFPYLRLLDLLKDDRELSQVANMGQRFCPAHPQVLKASERVETKS